MKPNQSCWVIKCRKTRQKRNPGWHWNEYLQILGKRSNSVYEEWGGPNWIKNHLSRKLIRERFAPDDILLCYQVEERQILGLTRLASGGLKVDGIVSAFDVAPPASAYALKHPLSIESLRATGCKPASFTPKLRGTVLEITADDLDGIIAAILAQASEPETEILAWLKAAGVGDGSRPPITHVADPEFPAENAGSSPEEIEKALASLEKALAARDDVYVRRKVAALIRRDGPLIQVLKARYNFRCQFPGCQAEILKKGGGRYCEVAHIQGVASGGKARRVNLLVLCPNHHKELDYGDMHLVENTSTELTLTLNGKRHTIQR